MLEEIAKALEQVLFTSQESTQAAQLNLPDTSMEVVTRQITQQRCSRQRIRLSRQGTCPTAKQEDRGGTSISTLLGTSQWGQTFAYRLAPVHPTKH